MLLILYRLSIPFGIFQHSSSGVVSERIGIHSVLAERAKLGLELSAAFLWNVSIRILKKERETTQHPKGQEIRMWMHSNIFV